MSAQEGLSGDLGHSCRAPGWLASADKRPVGALAFARRTRPTSGSCCRLFSGSVGGRAVGGNGPFVRLDLLRWFRFLWAIGVPWDRASRSEARDFSRWFRSRASRPGRTGAGAATLQSRRPAPQRRGVLGVCAGSQRNGVAWLLRLPPRCGQWPGPQPFPPWTAPGGDGAPTPITTPWSRSRDVACRLVPAQAGNPNPAQRP